jgi:hypothetical protein
MSDNSSNSWNDKTEELLNDIRKNCILLEEHHRTYYFRIKKIIVYFKLPIIFLSSLNAISAVAFQNYINQNYISAFNCFLSFSIGTLTSVSLYLRIEDRLETSLSSSKEYHKLSIEIYKMLSLKKSDRSIDADQFLNDVYNTYTKLFEKSNLLQVEIIDNLKKEIDNINIGISIKE